MAFTTIGQALGSTKSLRTNMESLLALGNFLLAEEERGEINSILSDLSEIIIVLTRLNNQRKARQNLA